jgi:DNA repair protein RecO (recombination protein O)
MLQTTRGIIFHHVKFSDTSIIARIYTEQFGLQSYLVRGLRNRRSEIKKALFQHLNLVEMVVSHRENKELQYLKELRIADPFHSIPFDIRKSAIALFLNEVLYQTIREEEPNPDLFEFLFRSVKALDNTETNISLFHLSFLIRLSRYLGFFPKNNYSDSESFFNLAEGRFSRMNGPEMSNTGNPFSKYISNLANLQAESFDAFQIDPSHRSKLLEIILNYYRYHIPGIGEFKSHTVLHDVLQ